MASRADDISHSRREKLDRIRARGIDPYPPRYHRSHTTEQAITLLEEVEEGQTENRAVSIAGRITAIRKMGKSAFFDIHDGSGKIQLLFLNTHQYEGEKLELFKDLDIGDFIGVEGSLVRTKSGEATVQADSLTMLAKSLQPLPEKWHGLSDIDTRYRQRYLDLIANAETRQLFYIRSQVIAGIRHFLNKRGFIEVETPVLQPSAGGALAQPFITHHHALDRDLYLRIALELYLKRLIIGGFDKVYELGRTFRNEGLSTKHNPGDGYAGGDGGGGSQRGAGRHERPVRRGDHRLQTALAKTGPAPGDRGTQRDRLRPVPGRRVPGESDEEDRRGG